MSELTRFRLARAPQKRAIDIDGIVPLHRRINLNPAHNLDPFGDLLNSLLQDSAPFVVGFEGMGITVLDKPAALTTPIDHLERWLTSRQNRPTAEALSYKLNELCQQSFGVTPPDSKELGANASRLIQLAGPNWQRDRQNIGFSLIVTMLRDREPSHAVYFNRLMLVIGLVELAAEKPDRLKTSEDVYWALRWRLLILPELLVEFLRNRRPFSLLARRPGFSDLYIVRDEWARYEAGEVAHVENVMASETRERSHTRITETEEIVTTEQERATLDERDSQSTDRFDLQQETSRDSSLNVGAEFGLDVSAQYGTAKINSHVGGSLDYSLDESQSLATTTAHEVVARAVVRVEERVREARTTRSLLKIEEVNKHAFKNDAQGAKHISGIYRWVDKIKRVQIFRYPNRFLLEFQVPEPGAWLRWLLDNKKPSTIAENPKPLRITAAAGQEIDLMPAHIKEENYLEIGGRYKTLGLVPPPKNEVLASALTRSSLDDPSSDRQPFRFLTDNKELTVIDGYKATTWNASVQLSENDKLPGTANIPFLHLAVGSTQSRTQVPLPTGGVNTFLLNGAVGDISQGSIPISVMTFDAMGYNINISVTCEPLPERIVEWQLDTYGKIAQAYFALKRQYDEEVAARSVRGGVQIQGLSPVQNAEMTRVELKKSVIEMLTAQDFTGHDAYRRDPNTKRLVPPEVDLPKAVQSAPEIQFIEQAFEWENLSYVLYPYFWTGKDQWDQLADLSGTDPDFARFLRAGSARVIVPARPGFESQAILYAYFGIIWGGGPAPAPGDEDYLSIADEIRAQEKPPRDGEPGESWEVRLPTTIVWLDTTNSTLPVENPDTTLDEPPGKVLP